MQDQERVFEAFAQTDAGVRTQEGTGLGLPLSRKFAESMDGDIQVQSNPGAGATFTLTIPVELTPSTAFAQAPSSRRVRALLPGQPEYRLLSVDDHPDHCRLLRKLLIVKLSPLAPV